MRTVEQRKWGYFEVLDVGDYHKVKRLVINPQSSISLQYHKCRAEHWVLAEGSLRVYANDVWQDLELGQSVSIKVGDWHRAVNNGSRRAVIIEVQLGGYLEEDDIVRYEEQEEGVDDQKA